MIIRKNAASTTAATTTKRITISLHHKLVGYLTKRVNNNAFAHADSVRTASIPSRGLSVVFGSSVCSRPTSSVVSQGKELVVFLKCQLGTFSYCLFGLVLAHFVPKVSEGVRQEIIISVEAGDCNKRWH